MLQLYCELLKCKREIENLPTQPITFRVEVANIRNDLFIYTVGKTGQAYP